MWCHQELSCRRAEPRGHSSIAELLSGEHGGSGLEGTSGVSQANFLN